jgi:hypothetical protein
MVLLLLLTWYHGYAFCSPTLASVLDVGLDITVTVTILLEDNA